MPGDALGKYPIVCPQKSSRPLKTMSLYNPQHITTFLDAVDEGSELARLVIENVSSYHPALVQNWFTNHDQLEVLYLPL